MDEMSKQADTSRRGGFFGAKGALMGRTQMGRPQIGRTQLAAGALLVGASLITAPGAQALPGDAVVYTVTSDAPLAAISYADATGATQALPNQTSPWTLSFTSKDTSSTPVLVVSAVPTGKQTTCTISVNGTVKDTKSSTGSGEAAQVLCSVM